MGEDGTTVTFCSSEFIGAAFEGVLMVTVHNASLMKGRQNAQPLLESISTGLLLPTFITKALILKEYMLYRWVA